MVDVIKKASKKTTKLAEDIWFLAGFVAMVTAGIGVANKPYVHTKYWDIPFWQIVAAVIITAALGYLWKLIRNVRQEG